jgi:hypothetical protein
LKITTASSFAFVINAFSSASTTGGLNDVNIALSKVARDSLYALSISASYTESHADSIVGTDPVFKAST